MHSSTPPARSSPRCANFWKGGEVPRGARRRMQEPPSRASSLAQQYRGSEHRHARRVGHVLLVRHAPLLETGHAKSVPRQSYTGFAITSSAARFIKRLDPRLLPQSFKHVQRRVGDLVAPLLAAFCQPTHRRGRITAFHHIQLLPGAYVHDGG